MAATDEIVNISSSFESEGAFEELPEKNRVFSLTKADPMTGKDCSRKTKERRNHVTASSSHKPPSSGRTRTGKTDSLNQVLSEGASNQFVVQKNIPCSRHIGVSNSTDQSGPHLSPAPQQPDQRPQSSHGSSHHSLRVEGGDDVSLALSDQVNRHSYKLRDAVFAEWLSEKGSHMKKEREMLAQKKRQQDQAKAEQMATRQAKVADSLQTWLEKKSASMRSVNQKQKQAEELKKQQEEKKLEKERESEEAAKSWRKEQVKKLMKEHRMKQMKEEKKEKAKHEENVEKINSANLAFKAWSEKKDKQKLKEVKEKKIKEQLKAQAEANDQDTRAKEAASAFKAWKTRKDEHIKQAGSLYTYNTDPRRPPKNKWCPARSIKYSHSHSHTVSPSDKMMMPRRPSSHHQSTVSSKIQDETRSVGSYSSCSFESGSVLENSSLVKDSRSRMDNGKEEQRTGKLKRVQVCCQIVEFWCTCEDSDCTNEEDHEAKEEKEKEEE